MKKYFYFDIDNTLTAGLGKGIPNDTRWCLEQLKAKGHFVSIATGRLQADALRFAEDLRIPSFVADGGNSLTRHNKLIEMQPLPREQCLAFIADVQKLGLPWAFTPENKIIRYTPSEEFIRIEKKSYFHTILSTIDPGSIANFYKLYLVKPVAGQPWPDWHGLPHFPYTENTFLIEPTNKAAGILRMTELEGGRPEDIVVFGDGLNDLQMFHSSFFSIAMGNARPQLKERADYITADCDKGGILKACQQFHWI